MKNICLSLLLLLSLLHSVSAQKTTFTFDYQIDMEDMAEYADTTKFKNWKSLRSTWLNSNDRTYVGMMCYYKDTTKNKLVITDFKTGKDYTFYTHRKKKKLRVKLPNKPYVNISEINVITADFKREKADRKIGDYMCEQIWQTGAGHSFETWFTRDIHDAPPHSFYCIYGFPRLPAYYNGVPLLYQVRSKDRFTQFRFLSAKKHLRSLTVNNLRVIKFEEDGISEATTR